MDGGRVFVLYDSRACGGDTGSAAILVVCEDNKEARSYRGEFGGMACFSYTDRNGKLVDEKHEWNWYER